MQADEEIEWEDEADALNYLELNDIYSTKGGILYTGNSTRPLTPSDISAINYLCFEWDYEWRGFYWKPT